MSSGVVKLSLPVIGRGKKEKKEKKQLTSVVVRNENDGLETAAVPVNHSVAVTPTTVAILLSKLRPEPPPRL